MCLEHKTLDTSKSDAPRRRRYSVDVTTYSWISNSHQPSEKEKKQLRNRNITLGAAQEAKCRELEGDPSWDAYQTPSKTKVEEIEAKARSYFSDMLADHPMWGMYEAPASTRADDEFKKKNQCLENARSSLHDPSYMTVTETGGEGWFHDEIVDVSFDFLSRILKCKDHRIALSNVSYAADLFRIGEQVLGKTDVLLEAYEAPHWDEQLVADFADKDFIIMPISDGYAAALDPNRVIQFAPFNSYVNKPSSRGSHWSVLIFDCRGPNLVARYLDSMPPPKGSSSDNMWAAQCIHEGMVLLQQHHDPARYAESSLEFMRNTPHQMSNNACVEDGAGACGPFLYLIAKDIVQYIVECKEDSVPIDNLILPVGYAERMAWDSRHTRNVIRRLVNRELRTRKWLCGTSEWWDEKGKGGKKGWQSWVEDMDMDASTWWWDPYEAPFSYEPQFKEPVGGSG
ncbi:hypothetical protein NX059_007092 [Plenodomus lindquistii]|nr:hypothetical protein NX059_007092 [Plenodomus lindquistii]